jgi:hypothetical protein
MTGGRMHSAAALLTRPAPALSEIVAAAEAWVKAERTIFHAGSEREADEAARGITAARDRFFSLVAAHAAEVAKLRNALQFYADPGGKCDQVPDFYDELDFGSRAFEALNGK